MTRQKTVAEISSIAISISQKLADGEIDHNQASAHARLLSVPMQGAKVLLINAKQKGVKPDFDWIS